MVLNKIRGLANETAIYGLSTVVPRFLNWLLVPYFTRQFAPAEYGVVTELYAYVTFLIIVLTYGMETAFFRYSEDQKFDRDRVFSTSFINILFTTFSFLAIGLLFQNEIANVLDYGHHPEYIRWFIFILSIDAIMSIPFGKLRRDRKALKFSYLKISGVLVNIALNILLISVLPAFVANNPAHWVTTFYDPGIGVGYIFIANLCANIFTLILLFPEIVKGNAWVYDRGLIKNMLRYALPLLVAGLAGNINEALDRVLLKHLLPPDSAPLEQLGIYGSNIKIAVLMTLFIQMFRYAFEPFFFKEGDYDDAKKLYADIMKYFVIFGMLIFMGINFYMDIIKYFEDPDYWEGLKLVPVVLFGYLLYGIFINLSVWYKLKNLTQYGAILTLIGAGFTVLINVVFVPDYGYMVSAWARVVCYGSMVVVSYWLSRKFMKIPYCLKDIGFYVALGFVFYGIHFLFPDHNKLIFFSLNTLLIIIYIFVVDKKEHFLKRLLKK